MWPYHKVNIFYSSLNQSYNIIICVYWFELFSQVSDVAHGPLVLKLTWDESSDNFFYLIACCPLFAVSHFSISSPKQVNISTKLTAGYPLVKGLQIYPRERTPLQVKIWLQYVGNELATNFFFRITESSLPY